MALPHNTMTQLSWKTERNSLFDRNPEGQRNSTHKQIGEWHSRNISMWFSGHSHINKRSSTSIPITSSQNSPCPLNTLTSSAMSQQPRNSSMSRMTFLSLTYMNSVTLLTATSTWMVQNTWHLGNQVDPNLVLATDHATPQSVASSTPRKGALETHANSATSAAVAREPTLTTNVLPQNCSKWICLGGEELNGA